MRIDNPIINTALQGIIGNVTPAAGTFTTLTSTGNTTLGDAEATDTHAIKGATTLLANSASAALTVTQTGAGNAFVVEDRASTDSSPFVIDGVGLVAIQASPGITGAALTIGGGTTSSLLDVFAPLASATGFANRFFKSRNTSVYGNTIVQSGDTLGASEFFGADGTNYIKGASISAQVDGTPGTNDMPGRLVFSTTADGASSPTERMRITSAGLVGIGVTPTNQLDVKSATNAIVQSEGGSGYGSFLAKGSAGNASYYLFNTGGTETARITADASNNLLFSNGSGATERMRIDSAGNVGIGGAPPAFSKVYVIGVLPSGSSASRGYELAAQIPSTSTAQGIGFLSSISTAASAFTLTNLYHFWGTQSTIGAGSAVTNQFGFYVDSTLTGATNNYGFYSNIASAANRYNFYAAGSALNYFAGQSLFGSEIFVKNGTATTAGGLPGIYLGTSFIGVYFGSGAPTVSAAKGSLYLRSDGADGQTRTYINTNGTTAWTALASVEGISGGTF